MIISQIKDLVKETHSLVYFLFKDNYGRGIKLTISQEEIVNSIYRLKYDRLTIKAYTGYGKTFAVAIGVLLSAIANPGVKIGIISRSQKQSSLLFNYILEFISRQTHFWALLKTRGHTFKELASELNRERMTIGDSSISVLTANINKQGANLLGWHFDLVIEDESAEIPDEISNVKIRRMLEESPNDVYRKCHIKISTPHQRGHFKTWCDDPHIKNVSVNYEVGIKEGRVTEHYIEMRKSELTDREFDVWYNCKFPEQDSDAVFTDNEINELLKPVDFNGWDEGEISISVDVARFGKDKTVITQTNLVNNHFFSKCLDFFSKKLITYTVGRVIEIVDKLKSSAKSVINLVPDDAGLGGGVTDMLKERYNGDDKVKVIPFNAGHNCLKEKDKVRFKNKASLVYFYLKELIKDGKVHYLANKFIRKELEQVKFEFTSTGQIIVAKKDNKMNVEAHSPDFVDSLCYGFIAWAEKVPVAFLSY